MICLSSYGAITKQKPLKTFRMFRNFTAQKIYYRYVKCSDHNLDPISILKLAFVWNVDPPSLGLTWSVSIMSARSFSDILRMEAAMDLALIIDLAERPPFAATALACLNLLLFISCCLTSWTSKSISLARAWRGRRRRNIKRRGWWNGYRKTRGIALPGRWINEIDQACAREA